MVKQAVTSAAWQALCWALALDVALAVLLLAALRACDAQEPLPATARRMLSAETRRGP